MRKVSEVYQTTDGRQVNNSQLASGIWKNNADLTKDGWDDEDDDDEEDDNEDDDDDEMRRRGRRRRSRRGRRIKKMVIAMRIVLMKISTNLK
ncbi:hypothetical protein ElyMa_000855300 [Elysia marginata]|uniref:Uncharacterized protein n=1 Tax=Elysia marginata TaxID=1093978 RepID=A0AAV4H3L7_9GAST|nr:hypothetical protein ElyMa_000855300 [Elysia marginata]